MKLLDELFRVPAVERIYSDESFIQSMLDFETALARAEARAGLIPFSVAPAISAKARAQFIDLPAVTQTAASAGNLAIPVIKQLTAAVAEDNPEAAKFVHFGATSQDVLDTAAILQLRSALPLLLADLDFIVDAFAILADTHRRTVLPARTWMQQALPTSLGFIFAGWLDAFLRQRDRLLSVEKTACVLQFGGAVGSLASLGHRGGDVARFLAEELHLTLPTMPWHSHRDRFAEVATTLGVLAGTLSKVAHDITLHSQTEVQEIAEPWGEGRGGSSTMPHKQNPVACAAILGTTSRIPGLVSTMLWAMDHSHQRALGSWHSEWETLADIVRLSAGALHHLAAIAQSLSINPSRMRENLDITRGLIFGEAVATALAEKIGRIAAHQRVETSCRTAQNEKRHLRDVLAADSEIASLLSAADLDRLFDPLQYLGSAELFIDRVLTEHRDRRSLNEAVQG